MSVQSKFTFTPMIETDIPFFVETRNQCCEFLHDNRKFDVDAALQWFITKYALNVTNYQYHIIRYDMRPIGYFRLSNFTNTSFYIGADINQQYQGLGLGYLAYVEFINSLPANEFDKIFLEVIHTNIRAIRLYLKLGFRFEGVKRNVFNRNNINIDSYIMSLTKQDWMLHESL